MVQWIRCLILKVSPGFVGSSMEVPRPFLVNKARSLRVSLLPGEHSLRFIAREVIEKEFTPGLTHGQGPLGKLGPLQAAKHY